VRGLKLENKRVAVVEPSSHSLLLLCLFDKKLLNLPVHRLLDMMTKIDRAQGRYLGACPWMGVMATWSIT